MAVDDAVKRVVPETRVTRGLARPATTIESRDAEARESIARFKANRARSHRPTMDILSISK